ncbi:MAG: hypothetical protein ACLPVY_26660 [Acidimicrobiia bacterium]
MTSGEVGLETATLAARQGSFQVVGHEFARRVRVRDAEGAVVGTVARDDLIAGQVVGLDEHGVFTVVETVLEVRAVV